MHLTENRFSLRNEIASPKRQLASTTLIYRQRTLGPYNIFSSFDKVI